VQYRGGGLSPTGGVFLDVARVILINLLMITVFTSLQTPTRNLSEYEIKEINKYDALTRSKIFFFITGSWREIADGRDHDQTNGSRCVR
jgi:hypothetical protein